MPEVGGVVHTHSPYATAWAARGEPIPCVLTAQADEFGGEIPVGPFALIGGDDIGKGIVATLSGHRSPAVLMRNHGVFTIGRDARAAVKAAVMCEDVARTVHLARQLGTPVPMAQADIDSLYHRYQNVYGQPGRDRSTPPVLATGPPRAARSIHRNPMHHPWRVRLVRRAVHGRSFRIAPSPPHPHTRSLHMAKTGITLRRGLGAMLAVGLLADEPRRLRQQRHRRHSQRQQPATTARSSSASPRSAPRAAGAPRTPSRSRRPPRRPASS